MKSTKNRTWKEGRLSRQERLYADMLENEENAVIKKRRSSTLHMENRVKRQRKGKRCGGKQKKGHQREARLPFYQYQNVGRMLQPYTLTSDNWIRIGVCIEAYISGMSTKGLLPFRLFFLVRRKNGEIFYGRCTGLSQDGSLGIPVKTKRTPLSNQYTARGTAFRL